MTVQQSLGVLCVATSSIVKVSVALELLVAEDDSLAVWDVVWLAVSAPFSSDDPRRKNTKPMMIAAAIIPPKTAICLFDTRSSLY